MDRYERIFLPYQENIVLLQLKIRQGILTNSHTKMDEYRLTDMEEPREEWLEQIMREAAEEARITNESALKNYFDNIRKKANAIV